MRITLDYYRILSVPIKATQEQIDRAFEDRCQQQPRREYSDFAIASRRKLLQQAHQKLSDEAQRAAYDAKFFTAIDDGNGDIKAIPESEPESNTETSSPQVQLSTCPEEATTAIIPAIEIPSELFAGALLIFYELAEYELILRLGVDYLNQNVAANDSAPPEDSSEESSAELTLDNSGREDVILSVVLSYLELSREQWRRNKFENAAISGQMGIDLLETEQLFPTLKAEMAMDVHKLKPYRILELLANSKSKSNSPERLKGLQLLQEMIRQRQGIEGKGNDYSGLTVEEFLHFIQQLRGYLTVKEQQQLFVAEAQRGSGVASFLAVYALIARGYVHQQPQFITEAQQLLQVLRPTQDISWEQAICSLLLGQTKQAILAIENSQESQIITAIKQHSQNAPDLLPGICFYGEKWLQEDVISQFWDLKDSPITLDEYFNNPQVQDYLEQLSPISPVASPVLVDVPEPTPVMREKTKQHRNLFSWGKDKQAAAKAKIQAANSSSPGSKAVNTGATATLERNPEHNLATTTTASLAKGNSNLSGQKQAMHSHTSSNTQYHHQQSTSLPRSSNNRSQSRYKSPLWLIFLKSGMLLMGLIFSLGALGFFITKQSLNRNSPEIAETSLKLEPKNLSETALEVEAAQLKTTEPTESSTSEPEKPALPVFDNASAQKVIQQWLDSKSAALGKSYQLEQLNSILAPDLLTKWSNIASYYQQTNIYRTYQHKLKIRSVVFDPQKPDVATVEAEVQEIAQHYQTGKLNSSQSYDDNLLVRYQLIKQGDSWLIQTSEVLKTL